MSSSAERALDPSAWLAPFVDTLTSVYGFGAIVVTVVSLCVLATRRAVGAGDEHRRAPVGRTRVRSPGRPYAGPVVADGRPGVQAATTAMPHQGLAHGRRHHAGVRYRRHRPTDR